MVFFEKLSTSLKQKWLEYYQKNRPWLILHMTDQNTISTPDGGSRPVSYLILGILNALEPELEALMLPFSQLKADADSLIEVLGLNFDPDIALGNKVESPSLGTAVSTATPTSTGASVLDDDMEFPSEQPVMPEEDKDSGNWDDVATEALTGVAAVAGGVALASALGEDSDDLLSDDQSDLDLEMESDPSEGMDDLDIGLDSESETVDDLDLGMASVAEADDDLDLELDSESEVVDDLDLELDSESDDDLDLDLESDESEAMDDLDLDLDSESDDQSDLDLGMESAGETVDYLEGFSDIEENSGDLSQIDLGSMEEETSDDYDLGKGDSDFIAENIPDPFDEDSHDLDESGLDELGGDEVLGEGNTSSEDELGDMELNELGDDNQFDDLSSDDLGDFDLDLDEGDLDLDDADLDSLAGDKNSSDDYLEGLLG